MTINCLTSFSPEGWATYARQCVESIRRHWPVPLTCYWEGKQPEPKLPGFDLLSLEPCRSFLRRYEHNLVVRGREQTPNGPVWKPKAIVEGYNWRLDVWKFSRKVFAIAHAARQAETGRLFWIDADVMAHTDVPVEFLTSLLPDGVDVCYIPRDRYHPETGLIGFGLNSQVTRDFIVALEQTYANDQFFHYPEWHDAAIFGYLLPKFPLNTKLIQNNSRRHPFEASVLAEYMVHYKGGRKYKPRLMQRDKPRFITKPKEHRSNLRVRHEPSGWWLPSTDQHFMRYMLPANRGKRLSDFDKKNLHEAFKYVRRWRVACDVGAHIGFWTKEMADRFKHVHAFEPGQDTYACLEANITEPNVTLYNAAVGPEMGWADLHNDPSTKRRHNTGSRFIRPNPGGKTRMLALDALDLPCCDLLKIDVEGFELRVLEGAERLIHKSRPVIIIETDKRFEDRYGLPVLAAQDFILARQYTMVARMRPDRIFVPKEHLDG